MYPRCGVSEAPIPGRAWSSLKRRFFDEPLLLPPSGNGDADGRSIVFLDEVDAGADMLDLEGGDVILAPPDGRGSHDRARIEGEQELGHLGRAREPGIVRLDPFHDVGGRAVDRDLAGPGEGRPPVC